jgi:hypothetical protein
VWDIFSNNHEVVGQSAVYDFGSFRGSARFIADFLNEKFYHNTGKYGYLDFYMGTFAISSRGDLLPFYQFVFSVLQSENCDWKYHFPRLFLFNLHKGDAEQDTQKPDEYNPEKAIVAEMEKKQKEAELKKFQDELEGAFQDEYEEAKYKPLIPVVQAYKNVFGKLPEGHPQKEFE